MEGRNRARLMLNLVKQVRSGLSVLNPEEIRKLSHRPVHIGLVAADDGYREMEALLEPATAEGEQPVRLAGFVHRAGDPGSPDTVDLVLYQQGIPRPNGAYTFYGNDPLRTVREILDSNPKLAPALARRFPVFRGKVVDRIIKSVAKENAIFAVVTALPDVIPTLAEIPWIFGEFASDTAFITGNQIRMAFLIASACGREIGYSNQKTEMLTIAASAFGWRAIARELAGKIPLGAGLIPKGAIAYAATYAIGKALERLHITGKALSHTERERVYREGLERGRAVAGSLPQAQVSERP